MHVCKHDCMLRVCKHDRMLHVCKHDRMLHVCKYDRMLHVFKHDCMLLVCKHDCMLHDLLTLTPKSPPQRGAGNVLDQERSISGHDTPNQNQNSHG